MAEQTEKNQGFLIRPMREEDLPQIIRIERASFAAPWSLEEMEAECSNPMSHYLVAARGEQVAAYGGFWHIVDEGHITNIATAPEMRRRGLGRMLVQALTALAKELGISAMTLEVRVSNEPAQRLYESCGFHGVGVRPGYYPDNREGALIMWNDSL